MWEIAIWIWIFFFAINGMLVYVDGALGTNNIVTPWTNQTISTLDQPQIYNTSNPNSLFDNVTSQNNATGGAGIEIWDTLNQAWNATIFFLNFITGSFIFDTLEIFGIPENAVYVFQGITGVFMAVTILQLWRGVI